VRLPLTSFRLGTVESVSVAALHDPRKSLSPLIQLVGRFTRSSRDDRLGHASVFVPRDPKAVLTPLRELLREDADWNVLLHDITERFTTAAEDAAEFDASFSGGPEEIPLGTLLPTLSAVAHRGAPSSWDPMNAVAAYNRSATEVLLVCSVYAARVKSSRARWPARVRSRGRPVQ
jgi:hypothetical protein